MSQQFDAMDDEGGVSSTDDEVLNPEDIDMDDTPRFPTHQIVYANDHNYEGSVDDDTGYDFDDFGDIEELISADVECEQELYGFWEMEEGVLECESINGILGPPLLLRAITHNIAALGVAFTCDFEDMEEDEWVVLKDCMMANKDKMSYLLHHSSDFPTKEIEEDFWQEVYDLCDGIVEHIIPSLQSRDEDTNYVETLGVENEHDTYAPVRDLQRKPWEQYLHHKAPGVKINLSAHGDEGSIQVFPMAAVRIVMGMVEETKAIISDIESADCALMKQREDGTPYQDNPVPGLYPRREKLLADGTLRSHHTTAGLLKPILAGSISATRTLDLDSLETLNQDFAALTGRRDPLRPRMWNCIGVIIRDRPQTIVAAQPKQT